MTRAKVLQVRFGGIPAHLSGHVSSAGLLLALIRMLHGGTLLSRARAVLNVAKLGFRQWREMSLQKKLSKLKNGTAKK
jgi:hypothetical protein